jgi:hypothetical protein
MIKFWVLASALSLFSANDSTEELDTIQSNSQQNKCPPWDSCVVSPRKDNVSTEGLDTTNSQQNKCPPWDSCVVSPRKDNVSTED